VTLPFSGYANCTEAQYMKAFLVNSDFVLVPDEKLLDNEARAL